MDIFQNYQNKVAHSGLVFTIHALAFVQIKMQSLFNPLYTFFIQYEPENNDRIS